MTALSQPGFELCARLCALAEGALLAPGDEPRPGETLGDLASFVHGRPLELSAWLSRRKPHADGSWQSDPSGYLRRSLELALQRKNQFTSLGPELSAALESVFERTLDALGGLALRELDPGALTGELASLLDRQERDLRKLLERELRAPCVVSAEYSPELQLQLLGLEPGELVEPILDLGCGESGALVQHCLEQGLLAHGIDRHASAPNTERGDWLAYDFAPRTLGTIVSHQAFSLHFLQQHLAPGDGARRYAEKYMELLRALVPGGSFCYAPGLPFIERHLASGGFVLRRRPLPRAIAEKLAPVFASTVGDVAYAARVTRARG